MDTGIHSLVAIARFHQLPAKPDQIAHQFGESGQSFNVTHILQAAKALTLKAKPLSLKPSDLDNASLPAIAQANDGSENIKTINKEIENKNLLIDERCWHLILKGPEKTSFISEKISSFFIVKQGGFNDSISNFFS